MKRWLIAFAGLTTLCIGFQAEAGPRPKRRAAQVVKEHVLDHKAAADSTDRKEMAADIAHELGDTPVCICRDSNPSKIGRLIIEEPTTKGQPFRAVCGIMLFDAEGDIDGGTPCLGAYEVL